MDNFKQGLIRVLVATDVAARGLDIDELSHVINFELPNNPEDYVHRIGRTGRAGTKGFAISLTSKEENNALADIEKLLGIKINTEQIEGFESKEPQVRDTNKKSITGEQRSKHGGSIKQNKKPNSWVKSDEKAVHFGKEITAQHTRRAKKTEDPLFTQPYVSKYSDANALTADSSGLHKKAVHRHHANKPIPALFITPAANKEK